MTIRTQKDISGRFEDLVFGAASDDASEQIDVDYLSDNSALLTVLQGKKQTQVTIAPHIVKALRDSLNRRYP